MRSLEHDVASIWADNPYSGNTHELITNYLADPTEEAVLHMVNADPLRTPTFAMFAKPDYYVSTGSTTCNNITGNSSKDCIEQTNEFAWDHGDYAAEIDTNWAAFAGPGVAHLGLDGSPPDAGPNSAGPNSGQVTVPQSGTTGTWIDETDIRPTVMYLTGLKDDYTEDGRVITQILGQPAPDRLSSPQATNLGVCYKQLNSSVGELGTATLEASTNAVESSSPGDAVFNATNADLSALDIARDHLAGQIKSELWRAEFANHPLNLAVARAQTAACWSLVGYADHLAIAGSGPSTTGQLPPLPGYPGIGQPAIQTGPIRTGNLTRRPSQVRPPPPGAAPAVLGGGWLFGYYCDQGRQDHRVVARADAGQVLQVLSHGPASPRLGFGPGIHQLETGGFDERGQEGTDIWVRRIGHRRGPTCDSAGRRDRFLGHQPAARASDRGHPPKHHQRVDDVQEEETAISEVDLLGQDEFLCRLGNGDDLGFPCLGCRSRHFVPAGRVDIDCIDPAVGTDQRRQCNGYVAAARPDVGAEPSTPEAKPPEGGLERASVDIVAQIDLRHSRANATQSRAPWKCVSKRASHSTDRGGNARSAVLSHRVWRHAR